MNQYKLIPIIFFVLFSWACQREEVKQYAAIESYPEDTFLSQIKEKRALVIIAHDDDMCAMTGTISMLNKKGWKIQTFSLDKGESRNTAHQKACTYILDSVSFMSLTSESIYRNPNPEKLLFEAFPKNEFEKIFKIEELKQELKVKILAFKPTVIFTLDNEIGGYGHPEHVLVSQSVLDLAIDSIIHPKAIYQSVFTDHMETSIMHRHSERMKSWGFDGNGWVNAQKAYETDGMPTPSVEINIVAEAEAKMNFLLSYNERERKTMSFFIPAFEEYSAEEYFSIFDREFFRVIKFNE
ncbi:MAG: PIG-L family deacetylase [Flavobacteriales bacterium]|nr:PIG-L family deacetylase [Flavobacteriales bacterium]